MAVLSNNSATNPCADFFRSGEGVPSEGTLYRQSTFNVSMHQCAASMKHGFIVHEVIAWLNSVAIDFFAITGVRRGVLGPL
jgi:hypothetical protein